MGANWRDERLMLAYRAGDAGAFAPLYILYRRYRIFLDRYLVQQCGRAALAEVLYQDICIKMVNARADYEPLARFSTWVFRITHHRLIDHYRKQAPQAIVRVASNDGDDDHDAGNGVFAVLPATGGVSAVI